MASVHRVADINQFQAAMPLVSGKNRPIICDIAKSNVLWEIKLLM